MFHGDKPPRGYVAVQHPCGTCVGCRLAKSAEFGLRAMHHKQSYGPSSFLTLTYDAKSVPDYGGSHTLYPYHMQQFNKSLRQQEVRRYGRDHQISIMYIGEYGPRGQRPHYHGLYFGFWPHDARPARPSRSGHPQWSSASLERLWGKGIVTIGEVVYDTAAYCARYTLKKLKTWYGDVRPHYETKIEEFAVYPQRPALGKLWTLEHKSDFIHDDQVYMDGRLHPTPRYYLRLLEQEDPVAYERLKAARALKRDPANNTPDRLAVRERVTLASLRQALRSYEHD